MKAHNEMTLEEYQKAYMKDDGGSEVEEMTVAEWRKRYKGKGKVKTSKRGAKAKVSYEEVMFQRIVEAGLPEPRREFRFSPPRRWRFDLDFGEQGVWLAVEIDGGDFAGRVKCSKCGDFPVKARTKAGKVYTVLTGGRHNRGEGRAKDLEKLNTAKAQGWTVIQVTPAQIKSGQATKWVFAAYKAQKDLR